VRAYSAPRKLTRDDDRSTFASGAADLDEWFARYAWQNQSANNATTYVTTTQERVAGYYSIAMAAVERGAAPAQLAKHRPTQIPCILLARLAVDHRDRGYGLGAGLLRDALLRSVLLSRSIGAAAVLVHCRDEAARDFYLHNGDFIASPVDDLHLILPVKALERYVD
jgi:GNAT superfamily N-acetyltransferase